MNSELILKIDDCQRSPKQFAFPEMSLSSSKASMVSHEFALIISAETITNRMTLAYEALVSELKRDDKICGSQQDQLAKAGYPELALLLCNESLIELVFGGYLMEELFSPLVWDKSCDIGYWYDETTACTIKGYGIEISGVCYGRP